MRLFRSFFPQRPAHPPPQTLILHPDTTHGQPAIHPQRILPLEGGINFRDLGGYPTSDGRHVRWGQVYRSGSFARLTPADLETIARLNIRLICDLRSPDEIKAAPELLPNTAWEQFSLQADDSVFARIRALMFNRNRLSDLMVRAYSQVMLARNGAVFGAVFRRLADPQNLPLLIRCTAGKDRTGLSAALLLLALGVDEAVVLADYSLSNLYFQDFQAFAHTAIAPLGFLGLTIDDLQPLLVADPATLAKTLVFLRAEYGSVEAYLRDQAGVDSETLGKVRANLLA